MNMHSHRPFPGAFRLACLLALAAYVAPAPAADSPEWQPMLAKSFKPKMKDIDVNGIVVNRNVGCVFLLVEGKGVYCSGFGANSFKHVNETWKEVCRLKTADAKHRFKLTPAGILESTDSGATWSKPIPLPRDYKISTQTWVEYDAKHDLLYLIKKGGDLYKLARRK
jgi:hypothetical protein